MDDNSDKGRRANLARRISFTVEGDFKEQIYLLMEIAARLHKAYAPKEAIEWAIKTTIDLHINLISTRPPKPL